MTKWNNALQGAINLLTLVSGFIKVGISGVRKAFTRSDFLSIQYIALKDLKVDKKYQRLINTNFIKKAKEFDPKLVKPLSIFLRPNGDYFIVDGQHTACLAGIYVKDAENFEVPCQVQEHPSNFTVEQCQEKEAEYFKEFNFLRNNVGTVEKLRADIARGVKTALETLETLQALGVHVEGIGDPDGHHVHGYAKLKTSISKYSNGYTKQAINHYCYLKDNKTLDKWDTPLQGGMILGLAAAFHFIDNYIGDGEKNKAFILYLHNQFANNSPKEWTYKTSGVVMDQLVLKRVIDTFNILVQNNVIKAPRIGEKLYNDWLDDLVHQKQLSKDSED